jgi:hypothetical protein
VVVVLHVLRASFFIIIHFNSVMSSYSLSPNSPSPTVVKHASSSPLPSQKTTLLIGAGASAIIVLIALVFVLNSLVQSSVSSLQTKFNSLFTSTANVLVINPSGGITKTVNNVLDDGNGNMTTSGSTACTFTTSSVGSTSAADFLAPNLVANSTTPTLLTTRVGQSATTSNAAAFGFSYNTPGYPGNTATMGLQGGIMIQVDGNGDLYVPGSCAFGTKNANANVSTRFNTLDDGHGNVAIVSQSSYIPLTLSGAGSSGSQILFQQAGVSKASMGWNPTSGVFLYDSVNLSNLLYQGGTTAGALRTKNNILDDGTGNMLVAGTVKSNNVVLTSDARLKNTIVAEPLSSVDKLFALNPVSFSYNSDATGAKVHGFIAQEVEQVFPELVSSFAGNDGESYKGLNYTQLISVLVLTVQQLKARIEVLEAR